MKPRDAWSEFQLEKINVPRTAADCSNCPCPLCRCAKYNPIGMAGTKDMVNKPVVNITGEIMDCETQPKVTDHGSRFCPICLQIMGRGIKHGCSKMDMRLARIGRLPRGRSSQRRVQRKTKRNLSVMVGRETVETQEQIVSNAMQRVIERKGPGFRLSSWVSQVTVESLLVSIVRE